MGVWPEEHHRANAAPCVGFEFGRPVTLEEDADESGFGEQAVDQFEAVGGFDREDIMTGNERGERR